MDSKEIMYNLDKLIPNPKCSLDYNKDYELLLAIMLSAQSTDKRVNIVTKTLFKYSLLELSNMELTKIEEIIHSVGTYHRKAIYIKEICTDLLKNHGGKVPHDREYIESLPGVGHKTCNVLFSEIFKENAIAVDTHVTRVSKRLGLCNKDDNVVKIEQKLMEKFPKDNWGKLHLQLVNFGREYCKARNPICSNCPFKKICTEKAVKF